MWQRIKGLFKDRGPQVQKEDLVIEHINNSVEQVINSFKSSTEELKRLKEDLIIEHINNSVEQVVNGFTGGLEELKRLIRRQGMAMEALNREVMNALKEKSLTEHYLQIFIDIVDTFFYLDSLNTEGSTTNPEIVRAWQLAWQKVEENLKGVGLVIVYKAGEVFDPSIHEAIERQDTGEQIPIIKAVIQPGYLLNGKVIRSAKVIL